MALATRQPVIDATAFPADKRPVEVLRGQVATCDVVGEEAERRNRHEAGGAGADSAALRGELAQIQDLRTYI